MAATNKLTDTSLMPFGEHKGKRMIDVPESYLLFLWTNNKMTDQVREYINDNLDVIKANQRK
jgi:uncharacterized protein (DUF3820 family)